MGQIGRIVEHLVKLVTPSAELKTDNLAVQFFWMMTGPNMPKRLMAFITIFGHTWPFFGRQTNFGRPANFGFTASTIFGSEIQFSVP